MTNPMPPSISPISVEDLKSIHQVFDRVGRYDTSLLTKQVRLMHLPDASDSTLRLRAKRSDWPSARDARQWTLAAWRCTAWLLTDPANSQEPGPFDPLQLVHELSPCMLRLTADRKHPPRSLGEMTALKAVESVSPSDVAGGDFQSFLDWIRSARSALELDVNYRSERVGTRPDLSNVRVEFPHPMFVPIRMQVLYRFFAEQYVSQPALAAVVMLVGIGNLHPFADGNGRTARLVYNWIMRGGRSSSFYLPIYECAALSEGGYLIRQRKAQYQGCWTEILDYLHAIAVALGVGSSARWSSMNASRQPE